MHHTDYFIAKGFLLGEEIGSRYPTVGIPVFLALASNFMDVDTIIPSMLLKAGGNAVHLGFLTAIMLGGSSLAPTKYCINAFLFCQEYSFYSGFYICNNALKLLFCKKAELRGIIVRYRNYNNNKNYGNNYHRICN